MYRSLHVAFVLEGGVPGLCLLCAQIIAHVASSVCEKILHVHALDMAENIYTSIYVVPAMCLAQCMYEYEVYFNVVMCMG